MTPGYRYKNRLRATIALLDEGTRRGFAASLGGGWFKVRGMSKTQGLLHLSFRLEARGWIVMHEGGRAEVRLPAMMTGSDGGDDAAAR